MKRDIKGIEPACLMLNRLGSLDADACIGNGKKQLPYVRETTQWVRVDFSKVVQSSSGPPHSVGLLKTPIIYNIRGIKESLLAQRSNTQKV